MEHPGIAQPHIEGGCYCGRISYWVQLPVKWCAHCHCTQCRHIQGAPFVTWYGVALSQFKILKGEQDIAWYDSSEKARRGHCIHCGTPLFFKGDNWPDEIHITRESTQQDIKQSPQVHVFYDRHVDYLNIKDELPKHGGVDGFTPLIDEDDKA